jgi:MHS family proline/betaine transporter-like MFS transporter
MTSARRVIAAGAIGNLLEWYDFALYGYFAAIIGRTFFPHEDPLAQLLSAYGVFAVGFVVRPLGGVVVGHIGDRFGRGTALTVSVAAMAVPTFLIGVLPGYQTLGLMAPVLLTLLRMVQGISVGGESSISIIFMVERASVGRRGIMGAVACAGATGGMMLGSASGAVLASVLPAEALESWGWRIPFLLGLAVGGAGYFLRRTLVEAPRAPSSHRLPLTEAVRDHGFLIFRLFTLSVLNAVGFFVVFVYIVTWLQRADGISPGRALGINTISMVLYMLTIVAMAWLSDRIGRKPMMMGGAAICLIGALPFFWLMHHPDPVLIFLGQLGFIIALGMTWGVQPSIMVEAVPPGVRCTVIALSFNLTMGLVGGVTPLVATWLVARTHQDLSPAFLITAAAVVTLSALFSFGESYRNRLAVA